MLGCESKDSPVFIVLGVMMLMPLFKMQFGSPEKYFFQICTIRIPLGFWLGSPICITLVALKGILGISKPDGDLNSYFSSGTIVSFSFFLPFF